MLGRLVRRAQMRGGEEGVGLILVIGISGVVFALAATAAAYAVNGVRQSANRNGFETALAVAESGIDKTLAHLQTAFSKYNADFPVPNDTASLADPTPTCSAPKVAWPAVLNAVTVSDAQGTFFAAGGRTAELNEKAWALGQLKALTTKAGCVGTAAGGKYVSLKPVSSLIDGKYPKFGKVYALAGVPSFATGSRTRLLKSEYVFLPYRPTNAVLTGGDLQFQGALTVTTASGFDPALASVHSNGAISVIGNAAVVTGKVSSTGTSAGSLSGSPITTGAESQSVPEVSASDFYFQAPANDNTGIAAGSWYDLCDVSGVGKVYRYSASGPCTGTDEVLPSTIGWSYDSSSHTWTASKTAIPGTYYVNEGNAANGTGNASFTNMTVIASSKNPDNCGSKKYGNIVWDHYDIQAPAFHNQWFYADGDVSVTSNIKIGQGATTPPVISGLIVSGDQTKLYTQSNSAVGAVIAADTCSSPLPSDSIISVNEIHSDLYYDPDSKAPFTSVITNTLWLDYSSG